MPTKYPLRLRPLPAWQPRPLFEPLEVRRLLAATLDPSFGGGDGYSVLPLEFDHNTGLTGQDGQPVLAQGLLQTMGQVGSDYFVSALYQYYQEETEGDFGTGIVNRTNHVLVSDNGSPRPGLEGDDDGNGVVRYDDVRIGNYNYDYKAFRRSAQAPDGSLLVSPGFTGSDDTERDIARLLPGAAFDENFTGVVPKTPFDFVSLSEGLGVAFTFTDKPGTEFPDNIELPTLVLFDTTTGVQIGDPITPFGDWITRSDLVHLSLNGGLLPLARTATSISASARAAWMTRALPARHCS